MQGNDETADRKRRASRLPEYEAAATTAAEAFSSATSIPFATELSGPRCRLATSLASS